MDKVSHEALGQLRRIAQKSSDKMKNGGGEEDEMSEPEILKLLMMHMSKNHHEDELEAFGDPEFRKLAVEMELDGEESEGKRKREQKFDNRERSKSHAITTA